MARLSKPKLLTQALGALRAAGWTATLLTKPGEHPMRFVMSREDERFVVRVYIWNLTHGGGANRPANEYRVQITSGVSSFEPEPSGVTLILGWGEQFGVFAAFDISHHTGPLGSSASIQIGLDAVVDAAFAGIAAHRKSSGEIAVAVRPELLASYIRHYEAAHAGDCDAVRKDSAAAQAPVELDFMVLIRLDREHKVGTAEEIKQRRAVLDRLEALEREMEAIRPNLSMIGHNNPPEALASDPSMLRDEVLQASRAITRELGKELPDVVAVAKGATTLQRLMGMFRAFGSQAAKAGQAFAEKARERGAEAAVAAVVSGGALYGARIADALSGAVQALGEWFRLIL